MKEFKCLFVQQHGYLSTYNKHLTCSGLLYISLQTSLYKIHF